MQGDFCDPPFPPSACYPSSTFAHTPMRLPVENVVRNPLQEADISVGQKEIFLKEVRAGKLPTVKAILQDHSHSALDIKEALDPEFLSPLCLACVGGHENVALFLLNAGADPNNSAGAAAAAANAAQGNPRDARSDKLLTSGSANSESFGSAPASPLVLAVETGLQRIVAELISRGARVDARRASDGWTALHVAASRGHALIMRSLLLAPLADVGMRTARLETPLSIASSKGNLAIVDMLLGKLMEEPVPAVDPTPETEPGRGTGTNQSTREGVKYVIKAITTRKSRRHAEERAWGGHTPLHRAAASGHAEVVLRLLAHGVDSSKTNSQGATALILAARGGHAAAAAALMQEGAIPVNTTTRGGDTALHAAAGISDRTGADVVRLLLGAGADVDARNAFGSTGEANHPAHIGNYCRETPITKRPSHALFPTDVMSQVTPKLSHHLLPNSYSQAHCKFPSGCNGLFFRAVAMSEAIAARLFVDS